jgi:N-acyl-phosphatidylethanolamine-hydrolysing phospholipase D
MRMPKLVTGVFLVMILSSCTHDPHFSEPKWLEQVENQKTEDLYAPHRRDGKFLNPWMPMEHGGFIPFLKWKLLSEKAPYTEEEKGYGPKFIPELAARIRSMGEGDFIAWIGHATFLIRLQGQYWLTDPMFSDRALLPKRIVPPAIRAEELNDLGLPLNVILSHNHYDHLDAKSIQSLPERTRFFVPLGLKAYVQSLHRGEVKEMDWWESVKPGKESKLVCLPAQHWSRRILHSTNTTLWASYLLVTPAATLYFGGDSGYFVGYREFGRRFQNIDYALLPTTAYHPRWFMHYPHMNVQEALKAFEALGAARFIPTQWGTFPLGDEPPGYPALDLKRAIGEMKLDPSRFLIMDIGEIVKIQGRRSEVKRSEK